MLGLKPLLDLLVMDFFRNAFLKFLCCWGSKIVYFNASYSIGKLFVTYRHFCIPFLISLWILQSNYYNLLDKRIAFCRIKRIYNLKFSNNIKYRRYSPTFVWLTDSAKCLQVCKSVSWAISYVIYLVWKFPIMDSLNPTQGNNSIQKIIIVTL